VGVVYDGDGNRVSESVGGVTTKFLVDTLNPTGLPQVIDELVNNSVTRTYAYGLQRISENQLIGNTWTPSFYGYDGHGNVRFLTNSAGTVTDSYTYDAFGLPITTTGTTPNNYLYSGEQYDGALGLYYLRARYYNPATGRFLVMDPYAGDILNPATLHKYAYTENNPINAIDATGQSLAEYVQIFRTEVLPAIVYAARLVCYVQSATVLGTEAISFAATGKFYRLPYPLLAAPCAALALPFPPSPPGGG
jgi:RHS repeat-associated protein